MAKKSFFKGAVILGIAGIIVKVFGAFFRIPLANIIGDTGMGYYQTAYPVYVLLLTLSTAGIPTAIARLVSERTTEGNHKEAYRIFTVSFRLLLAMGIVTSLLLFLGAPYIVQYMKGEPEAIYSMRSIAPALLFVPIMAAFRGYFQGQQDMTPTASSQVIEQAFRVVFGLSMAVILLPAGLKFAAAGASAGAAAGGFFGLIGIFAIYMRRRSVIRENCRNSPDGESEAAKSILWKIVVIAVPVTIGAAIMPIMTNIDLAIVVRRLVQSGYSSAEANSLYGQLSGFATPLINLPQVLTQAIAMSLVPAVASAFSAKDQEFLRYNTAFGIRTAMIIGMPCSVGLMVLSKPIMLLLYPAQQASAVNAAESLFILAFGAIFLSLVQTLTGILQGVKRQLIPVINLAIGAGIKVIITYVLTGIPSVNVKGAAAGTAAAYITAALLNYRAVRKYTGSRPNFSLTFGRPMLSAAIMGAIVWAIYSGLSLLTGNTVATMVSVFCGVVVYGFCILRFKGITPDEIKMLPKGAKIVAMLRLDGRK
ncbi:MAG: polysaccharide biosynthesis protein [Anaerovoracaceae bacterium]|mgnify:FL=1